MPLCPRQLKHELRSDQNTRGLKNSTRPLVLLLATHVRQFSGKDRKSEEWTKNTSLLMRRAHSFQFDGSSTGHFHACPRTFSGPASIRTAQSILRCDFCKDQHLNFLQRSKIINFTVTAPQCLFPRSLDVAEQAASSCLVSSPNSDRNCCHSAQTTDPMFGRLTINAS